MVPTLLTLGNVVCGFAAVCIAAGGTGPEREAALLTAACLVYLAMVFDALDGSVARKLKSTSEFGAQLDSLCDAVSFGAAPGLLMLQFARGTGWPIRLLWLIATLYVVAAVLRLARFNADAAPPGAPKPKGFTGLPSPAAAGTVASLPLMVFGLRHLEFLTVWDDLSRWLDMLAVVVLPPVTLGVAGLMVSKVHYPHLVRHVIGGRRSRTHLVWVLLAAAVVALAPQVSVPALFGYYAFAAPVRAGWGRWRRVRPEPPPTIPPAAP